MTKKKTQKKKIQTREQRLIEKLNPNRFTGMSGKMAAIVGYVLGVEFTRPSLAEIVITRDGIVMGRKSGDIGMNDFIGSESDLRSNWLKLLDAAGLTVPEKRYANALYMMKIRKF